MQILPLTTQLRDAWDDALEDGVIDAVEIVDLTARIANVDDSQRVGLRIARTGMDTHQTRAVLAEYQRLHGPIDFQHEKTRRRDSHPDSAA